MKWFGESWGAPACDPASHVDTPVGMECEGHEHLHGPLRPREIELGDQGITVPGPDGRVVYHLDCWLHEVGADRL